VTGGGDDRALTDLGPTDVGPRELLFAEWRMRRVANHHHCARLRTLCPDPVAHTREAKRLSPVLTAIGALPYTSGKPAKK
jgi:hypothetical protein